VVNIFSRKKYEKTLRELFIDISEITKKAFETMTSAIVAYVDGDFEIAEKEAEKTIKLEKKQDRVKEELFARLYTRESMVFSRSDRILIIENIDKITDKIEIVVRKLTLDQQKIESKLGEGIKEIASLNSQIGIEVHEMVMSVLDDFKKAEKHITHITDLRRTIREKKWELQKLNYDVQKDFLAFRYVESLIKDLVEAANRAEIFADRIFILIHKYTI